MKIGLVLEGGGMRGLYTIGVLDCFHDRGFYPDYVVGVSAGACNAVSYLSGQRGRNFRINTEYVSDKRYVSLHSYLKTKSMFGMDFIFNEIPNSLDPFDYEALRASPVEFYMGVTDVQTGKPVYFPKEYAHENTDVLRASSAIPVFSPMVEIEGRQYLDGGTSDAIPVRRALEDGCDRLIVVLTQHRDYCKKPEKFRAVYRRTYKDYPQMVETLDRRHAMYNGTLKLIRKLEQRGKALVIAPQEPVKLSRFEKDIQKLTSLYKSGMLDAQIAYAQIEAFCKP